MSSSVLLINAGKSFLVKVMTFFLALKRTKSFKDGNIKYRNVNVDSSIDISQVFRDLGQFEHGLFFLNKKGIEGLSKSHSSLKEIGFYFNILGDKSIAQTTPLGQITLLVKDVYLSQLITIIYQDNFLEQLVTLRREYSLIIVPYKGKFELIRSFYKSIKSNSNKSQEKSLVTTPALTNERSRDEVFDKSTLEESKKKILYLINNSLDNRVSLKECFQLIGSEKKTYNAAFELNAEEKIKIQIDIYDSRDKSFVSTKSIKEIPKSIGLSSTIFSSQLEYQTILEKVVE